MKIIDEAIQEIPLIHVDIKHGDDEVTRLTVYEGDDIESVANDFAKKLSKTLYWPYDLYIGIPDDTRVKLLNFLGT